MPAHRGMVAGRAILATAELLDGAGHQRQPIASPAGEGVGGAEGRGDGRWRDDELPRSADVEASLEPGLAVLAAHAIDQGADVRGQNLWGNLRKNVLVPSALLATEHDSNEYAIWYVAEEIDHGLIPEPFGRPFPLQPAPNAYGGIPVAARAHRSA